MVNDTIEVITSVEPKSLTLVARGWPAGEAAVALTVTARDEARCAVSIAEDAVKGAGALIPQRLRQLAIGPRNVESMRRLAYLAEGRYRQREA